MNNYPDYCFYHPKNLIDLLNYSVSSYKNKDLFEFSNSSITYYEFYKKVISLSNDLKQYNGKYIRICTDDPMLFAIGFFAVRLSDNISVLIDQSSCSNDTVIPDVEMILDTNIINTSICRSCLDIYFADKYSSNQLCTIIYSSGTTSSLKGVMLSDNNLTSNTIGGLEKYQYTSEDRLVHVIPYYHAFGLVCDLLAPMLSGSTICIPDNKLHFVKSLNVFSPTMLNVPPAFVRLLVRSINLGEDIRFVLGNKLSKILCGGAGLSSDLSERLFEYNILTLNCYGMTECSPGVTINRDNYFKFGSCGIKINSCEIYISSESEIIVKGKNVMVGYYNKNISDYDIDCVRTFYTGDLGYFDDDGFLYVVGRKSNLIVFDDGTKCSPERIEMEILKHPLVNDVIVFSTDVGEVKLHAMIYPSDQVNLIDLKDYIANIPMHHRFDSIEFTTTPLDKSIIGKVKRNNGSK